MKVGGGGEGGGLAAKEDFHSLKGPTRFGNLKLWNE